jgi:hypothetical protein
VFALTNAEVRPLTAVEATCEALDPELLFVDWLNTIIYEMAVRRMLFGAVCRNDRRHPAGGQAMGGTGRSRAARARLRAEGCDLYGIAGRSDRRFVVGRLCRGRLKGPQMDTNRFTRVDATTWRIDPHGAMRVPAVIYADEDLIRDMDDKVYEQAANVATLPGIVQASYAMPDAHWGYGFPIGGVAAFDPDEGGVVSAGGVGFDISCGVRTMLTGLKISDVMPVQSSFADSLFRQIPAGLGSRGAITLDAIDMDAMLAGGASWAVERGWGEARDLERIEETGRMAGAQPEYVSERAKERQRREMGTLGSRQPLPRGSGCCRHLRR